MRRPATVLATVTVLGVLAGCGSAPAPPAPAPPEPAPSAAPAPATPEDVVCQDYTDSQSVVRQVADAMTRMPVLPAGVAVLLLGSRQVATTGGVTDPELRAAQAELVAAIDDLDTQARALLGPDGNAAQDAVELDAQRILAAVTEIERVCAAR